MIIPMAKVRLLGARARLPDVLASLQELGLLHLGDAATTESLQPLALTPRQQRLHRQLERILDDIDTRARDLRQRLAPHGERGEGGAAPLHRPRRPPCAPRRRADRRALGGARRGEGAHPQVPRLLRRLRERARRRRALSAPHDVRGRRAGARARRDPAARRRAPRGGRPRVRVLHARPRQRRRRAAARAAEDLRREDGARARRRAPAGDPDARGLRRRGARRGRAEDADAPQGDPARGRAAGARALGARRRGTCRRCSPRAARCTTGSPNSTPSRAAGPPRTPSPSRAGSR